MAGEDERRAGRPASSERDVAPGAAGSTPQGSTHGSAPGSTHGAMHGGGTHGAAHAGPTRPIDPPRSDAREPRLPLEKLASEFLKRGISAGRDVGESIFPRELASNIASQLVDARHGLVNAIANEVGRFLRQADIASEVRKVLAGLSVEAKVQLRFSEDDKGNLHSKVELESPPRKGSKPPPAPEK